MSELDEMIRKLCPNEVEYKRFDEVCTLNARIGWQRLTRAEYQSTGKYMLITGTDFTPSNEVDYSSCVYVTEERYVQDKKIQIKNGDILITKDGTLGKVAQVKNLPMPATLNGGIFVVRCKDDSLLERYIMHFLLSSQFKRVVEQQKTGSTISHLTQTLFSRLLIPVPPLQVQEKIVNILDKLTELTEELTAELTAELAARKKQYQYYLNTFFEAQKQNIVTISELGSLTRGKRFVHADTVEQGIPCIHYGELYTYYGVYANIVKSHIREELRPKMRYAHKGDVIIVGAGENNTDIGIGVAWGGDDDVAVHDACYTLSHKQNAKYISYYLRSDMYHTQIKKYVSEGKICSISAVGLGKALIPIPSLEEQNRIVSILERFDVLCNNISNEIEAEIKLRYQQYQYYSDKMLNFELEVKA